MKLNTRLQDQMMLTNLLVQISSQEKIDAAFEEKNSAITKMVVQQSR